MGQAGWFQHLLTCHFATLSAVKVGIRDSNWAGWGGAGSTSAEVPDISLFLSGGSDEWQTMRSLSHPGQGEKKVLLLNSRAQCMRGRLFSSLSEEKQNNRPPSKRAHPYL